VLKENEMAEQLVIKKQELESTSVATAYAVVSAILIIMLQSGTIGSIFSAVGLRGGYNEMYTFAIVFLIGALASTIVKTGITNILSVGIVASFFVLTLNQEPLVRYLTLGGVLFSIGMYGMVASRNAVRVLMSIELMLNAVNINLVAFARYVDPKDVRGQIFAIFILTVAAAEAAVGIAIVLAIYRNSATVDMDKFNLLKW
jgi:NAD(P)H-quinone oxidoreductase subunit 4L